MTFANNVDPDEAQQVMGLYLMSKLYDTQIELKQNFGWKHWCYLNFKRKQKDKKVACIDFFFDFFFYPLCITSVFLVCFACYALFHNHGHSHLPPLIPHYVSNLILTFVETKLGHMAPTCECTHLTNSVLSRCELVTIFFQTCEASRHIFSTPCGRKTLKCISQIIRKEWRLNLGPSNL